MKRRVLLLLSLLPILGGCAGPAIEPDARHREAIRSEAARQRYWKIQAENAPPPNP